MQRDSLVERLAYRLIKKHIAGPTMNSAIEKAQWLSREKMLSSIMFLSDAPENKTKARYITTTYTELIRRISRLGLKASVHVPVDRIGGFIDGGFASENLMDIVSVGNKAGVFVWAAFDQDYGKEIEPERFIGAKGFGIAAPEDIEPEIADRWNASAVKILFSAEHEKERISRIKEIKAAMEKRKTVVIASPPKKLLSEISNPKFKKGLVLEFGLGYSRRKIAKLAKKGFTTSMCVPFGKDWTSYAISMVPESKAGFIVGSLLKEEEKRVV